MCYVEELMMILYDIFRHTQILDDTLVNDETLNWPKEALACCLASCRSFLPLEIRTNWEGPSCSGTCPAAMTA